MKYGIAIIELIAFLLVFLFGLYFYKVKNTEHGIMFLTGDYSGLDVTRICRDTGKRFMIESIPFLVGIVIDFFNPSLSIKISFGIYSFLLLLHIIDMCINRNKRYHL